MRVVFAPDSFKGTASADRVAAALASGWRTVRPDDELVLVPMADGGEGTVDGFAMARPDGVLHDVEVEGPEGPSRSAWLELPDGTAVVELASACGIELWGDEYTFDAGTHGLGEVITAALDGGARRLLVGIGSSASTDGGAGMLAALGARIVDVDGDAIGPGNAGLAEAATLDLSDMRPLPEGGVVVLCDVTNPLLGPAGAAAVFGPQKGATPEDIPFLEENLAHLASLGTVDPFTPGAGAAGGTGWALLQWGATIEAGAGAVAREVGLEGVVATADIVVTGEGRFDDQTAAGKVPAHVASLAPGRVMLVAGSIDADTSSFLAAVDLVGLVGQDRALSDTAEALELAGSELARVTPR
ncbi:glycerate kinase [Labedella gwakjiensis]|uniref:Glycerate kinase n=1 Tax=Labedella gwakjiensis TaxID=390269 RepID=A0A2P8GVJ1_9MICO|nr:glycerate kinase [Labedella gwakjiensis]PSL37984.1 glycerate kinase [Labedella gwakjiensis]RUQ87452.1 glycerate kinase [Labedella gwakjiensis]